MPMSCLESDLGTLFASSDFGEADGTIFRASDPTTGIAGIFDDEDIEVQNGEGNTVIAHQATLACASSKVPDLVEGEIFTIRGQEMKLKVWKNDGTGVVELFFQNSGD